VRPVRQDLTVTADTGFGDIGSGDSQSAAYDPGYGPLVSTRVRIATWNLWGWYGPWAERMGAIESSMRAVDADIWALQEVWADGERNQARVLASALGYEHVVFDANLERDGAFSGNAVVSRWPIRTHDVLVLPRTAGDARDDEGEERLVVFAEIDGPRGPIQVYCAHLSWRDDHSAIRQAQVAEICRLVRECRPRTFPAVLCGDLNADPTSDELRMLTGQAAVPVPGVMFRDAWLAAGNAEAGATASNANPFNAAALDRERRIDFVLVGTPKLGGVGHVLEARLAGDAPVDGVWPSDHLAVVAELRY
jgi:endonuclease/exonuclease/phosphatase family metal-dependent hydrolase